MLSSICRVVRENPSWAERNALKGKNNGGGVPLGYLLDKKAQKLVIDPVTAPLAIEIFEKYVGGKTTSAAAQNVERAATRKQFARTGLNVLLSA